MGNRSFVVIHLLRSKTNPTPLAASGGFVYDLGGHTNTIENI